METLAQKFEIEQKQFLTFLKGRFNLFHQSNVFFRDIHYGVMAYLEMNNLRSSYTKSEELTRNIVGGLEKKGILLTIDRQTFVLLYPEFRKPVVKKPAPAPSAKPAAQTPAKPAGAAPAKPLQSAPAETEPTTEAQTG